VKAQWADSNELPTLNEPDEIPELSGVDAVSSWSKTFSRAELAGDALVRNASPTRGEPMSAEFSLTAVEVVKALLNEDTEGLAVLLPDGLPEPGRELLASLPA
jgi:hypothetical protein